MSQSPTLERSDSISGMKMKCNMNGVTENNFSITVLY